MRVMTNQQFWNAVHTATTVDEQMDLLFADDIVIVADDASELDE